MSSGRRFLQAWKRDEDQEPSGFGSCVRGLFITFFHEAVTEAVQLHWHLLPLMVIGWDIAITLEGPLFIEGNDNIEISINQEVNGGLRKPFESIVYSFHHF